jgi:RimJ/RimL family protein N-acetyltransferase
MAYLGERVSLRAVEPDDLDRYVEWLNDPEVTRTLTIRYPLGVEAEREFLERTSKNAGYEDVVFAVDVSESGEHIGTVGLHGASLESRWATLGIFIGAKRLWGDGYGFDALRTVCRFGFWEMNLLHIRLDVFGNNERAHNLYRRVGFVDEGARRGSVLKEGRALDVWSMSVTRAAFEALHGEPADMRTLEVLP